MKLTESILPKSSMLMMSAVTWVLAFAFSLLPFKAYQDSCFLVAVVLCIFAAVFAIAGADKIDYRAVLRPKVALAFLAFWAVGLISVLLSDVPFVSFIYFCFFSVFPLSFLLMQGWRAQHWLFAASAMAVLLGSVGAFALVQFFFLPDWLFFSYASWPFANPNSLGAMIVAALFGVLGWMLGAPSKRQSTIALVLAIILGAALFTTGSRGAFFSAVVMMGFFLFYARGFFKRHWKCLSTFVVASPILFVVLMAISNSVVPDPITEITKVGQAAGQADWDQRLALWQATWRMIGEHFWTGTGIGTYFLYYPEVRGADFGTAGYMAHFEPLQFWAEQGIFAPVLFYGLLGMVLIRTVLRLSQLPVGHPTRLKILTPFCALGAMTLHTHVSYNFHVLALLMLAGAYFAYWYIWSAPSVAVEEGAGAPARGDMILRYGLAAPLVVVLALFGPWQASEIAINRAQSAVNQGRMNVYYDLINRAGHLSGRRNARALIEAAQVPMGIAQLNGPLMNKAELLQVYEQAMGLLDEAEATNSRLARVYYHKAELLRFTQMLLKLEPPVTQEEYLRMALKVQPNFAPARLDLSSLLVKRGDADGAYQVLLDGIEGPYLEIPGNRFYDRLRQMATARGDQETLARIDAAVVRARAQGAPWARDYP